MSGRAYILCVDDEQAVLNQLSAQLARGFGASHLIECSESAEEALTLIKEIEGAGDEVELVICDQVMPGMKGDRFLEALSQTRPELMKVLLTGQAGLDSAIYAINHGGLHRYIEKPWEAEDLTLTVQNLLGQFRLRRELQAHHERLERRDRELRSLHVVGQALAGAETAAQVLGLASEAAAGLARARAAAALARVGAGGAVSWAGAGIADDERRRLELELERLRAEGRVAPPAGLPEDALAVPLRQGGTLAGWIVLAGAAPACPDTQDLLAILAGQAGGRLDALRLAQERIESERLSTIGRMLSTIIHDFRNPMTAIKGYVGMIEELDELPRETRKEYARLILEEAEAMGLMIDEILEFTRGGHAPLHLACIGMDELVARIRRLIEPEFRSRRMTFRTELGYAGEILVDVDRIKRAVLNVARNAAEAMEPGGTFTVRTWLEDGLVQILLSDTGHGMPEEIQRRIFEPFFTHGKERGIGLGMAITRKIVEEHGGRIRVESDVGAGSRFVMTLPVRAGHGEWPRGGAASRPQRRSGG